jgi:hypothetical protein
MACKLHSYDFKFIGRQPRLIPKEFANPPHSIFLYIYLHSLLGPAPDAFEQKTGVRSRLLAFHPEPRASSPCQWGVSRRDDLKVGRRFIAGTGV